MELEQAVFRMIEVMLKDQGVQKLADEASKVLGRPLWLTDLNYHFLTNPEAVYPVDRQLTEGYRSGMIGRENLVYLHREKIVDAISRQSGPYVYYDESLKRTLAVTAVRVKGVVTAHIAVLVGERPLSEQEIAFLNRLKDVFSLELQRTASANLGNRSVRSLILSELLEQRCTTMDRVYSRLEAAGYELASSLRLIVIRRRTEVREDFPWQTVEEQIAPVFRQSLHAEYHGHLILLMNQDSDMTQYQLEQLRQFMEHSELRAGVSYRFSDLSQLYRVYVETRDLLYLKDRLGVQEAVSRYEDAIVELAVAGLEGKLDPHSIAGDSVAKLTAYDQKYGQESLPTLKAYVECSFDLKRTAEKLHVHVNTMRYRVSRLREIMGIDLTDSRIIFELVLALGMLDLEQAKVRRIG